MTHNYFSNKLNFPKHLLDNKVRTSMQTILFKTFWITIWNLSLQFYCFYNFLFSNRKIHMVLAI